MSLRSYAYDDMLPIAKQILPPPIPTIPEHNGCSYMKHVFASPEFILDRANRFVGPYVRNIDTFVGIGNSGVAILMFLAHHFRRTFAIVRKEGVRSHSSFDVEGRVGSTWLFVDDLIASGSTWRRVSEAMHRNYPNSHCYGAYLYEGECNDPNFKMYPEIVREFGDWT